MLHLDRNGDEPPASAIENNRAHDLAVKAECFGHVDVPELGNTERRPIDREFIIGQIEAQAISFLALKAWKAAFLTILAWVFELGKCPFLLHAQVVRKGLPKMAKLLFWGAFGDLVAPGKLLALDLVVLRLEVFH